jgi:hypothetical protein
MLHTLESLNAFTALPQTLSKEKQAAKERKQLAEARKQITVSKRVNKLTECYSELRKLEALNAKQALERSETLSETTLANLKNIKELALKASYFKDVCKCVANIEFAGVLVKTDGTIIRFETFAGLLHQIENLGNALSIKDKRAKELHTNLDYVQYLAKDSVILNELKKSDGSTSRYVVIEKYLQLGITKESLTGAQQSALAKELGAPCDGFTKAVASAEIPLENEGTEASIAA